YVRCLENVRIQFSGLFPDVTSGKIVGVQRKDYGLQEKADGSKDSRGIDHKDGSTVFV
ncbi:Hypothetical protein SMAX5B_009876, partial [Scophthalmus maximus]